MFINKTTTHRVASFPASPHPAWWGSNRAQITPIPFMQNKANFRRDENGRNLSYNKHLRRKTTPEGPKNKANSKPIYKKAKINLLVHVGGRQTSTKDQCAHKTTPIMQNKANLPTPANEPNLRYNKHLRTQTTPGGPKKQSQFKPNFKPRHSPPRLSAYYPGYTAVFGLPDQFNVILLVLHSVLIVRAAIHHRTAVHMIAIGNEFLKFEVTKQNTVTVLTSGRKEVNAAKPDAGFNKI